MRVVWVWSVLAGCAGLRPLGVETTPATDGGPGDTATPDGADADTDADTDTDTDTVVPTGDLQVSSVYPDFGTNGGGEEVTILGGPFDANSVVTFGGATADLVSWTESQLVVETPSNAATGWVDVAVTADAGTGVAPAAYQFWEDGAGQYGALGEVSWYLVKGGYWDPPNPPPYGGAQVWFSVPTPDPYWKAAFTGSLNTCSLSWPLAIDPYDPGSPALDLVSGNKTITLPADPSVPWLYWAGGLSANEVGLGIDYDVPPPAGAAADWPSFTATDFAKVPTNDPGVTSPAIAGATIPTVTENGFNIVWSSPFDGDYVVILANRGRLSGGVFTSLEWVSCASDDDGAFKIPAGSFSGWDPAQNDVFYLYVGRAVEGGGPIPYDGSTSGVAGILWEVGFAVAG